MSRPKTAWERISEDDEPKDHLTANERRVLAGVGSITKAYEARKPKKRFVLYHDDSCGELLEADGRCPRCGFYPDMQSTGFKEVE